MRRGAHFRRMKGKDRNENKGSTVSLPTKRFEGWMNSVESISELINDSLEEIDFNRCLPKKVLDALHDAKIFRMSLQKSWEAGNSLQSYCRRPAERLARADASVGWCFGQGTGCAMSASSGGWNSRGYFWPGRPV